MKQSALPYQPISALKLTLIVVLAISVIFPVFFAYIDHAFTWPHIGIEILFAIARLSGIAFICYGVIQLTGRVVGKHNLHWLRNLIEISIIFYIAYWFLYFFVEWIDAPITHSNPSDLNIWTFRRYIGLHLIGTTFIYIFLSGLNFYQLAQLKAAEAEKFQRDFAQVRLQALKSQVNPHFLFNSLSVLSSLVHVNAELSEKFIIQLSKAYRYILDQKELELVTLKEELEFLDAYFFLLQIRFDQKVQLQKEIAADTSVYKLPPLTLQLLVENAVKHNKMSAAEPLVIVVTADAESLSVENNTSKREQHETSTGIGLDNIKKRYALVTGKAVMIKQTEKTFAVKIPLIK